MMFKILNKIRNILKETPLARSKTLINMSNKLYAVTAPKTKDGLLKVKVHDFLMWADCKDITGVSRALIQNGSYEEATTKLLLKELPEKGTFLDVGANIGYFTVLASKKAANIWAFEPEPKNATVLRKNVKLNNMKNTHIAQIALSEKKGKIKLSLSNENRGGHSIMHKNDDTIISVKTQTLDSFVKTNRIEKIHLVKIDVEGAELRVLHGMKETLRKYKPKVLIEIFPKEMLANKQNPKEIFSIFDGYDIKYVNEEKKRLEPFDSNELQKKYSAENPFLLLCK